MRWFLWIALVFPILTFGWGCTQPLPQRSRTRAENCLFRDSSGDIVATAYFELPQTLPTEEAAFEGTWKLISSKPAFPSDSSKSGSYTGYVHEGAASIYLNRDFFHNSILVGWAAGTETITGPWWLMTDSGGRPMGTFNMTRLPNDRAN